MRNLNSSRTLILVGFFCKKEKCLESPEMARKLIRFLKFFLHTSDENFRWFDGGLSGGSSVRRPPLAPVEMLKETW